MATIPIHHQPKTCTLYELEDNLQGLADCMSSADELAAREVILDEIGQALRRTKEKRDAVVAFLHHCKQQEQFATDEIARISKRKEFMEQVRTQLECYVVQVIDRFAAPDRRGIKRLDGNFSGMRIQKNPESVVITDLAALPLAWKDVILTLPAYAWEALLQRLHQEERSVFEQHVKKCEFKPDKRAIGNELKNGAEIPGADLKFGDLRLVID